MNDVEVLRTETADKLQGWRGSLDYSLIRTEGKLAFRIDGNNVDSRNTASENSVDGTFSAQYIFISDIQNQLTGCSTDIFGSRIFSDSNRKDNNNQAFIAAILRNEGLIEPSIGNSVEHKLVIEVSKFEQHLLRK